MKSGVLQGAEGKQRSRKIFFQSAFLGCVLTAFLWAAVAGPASAGTWFRAFNNSDIPMAVISAEQLFVPIQVRQNGDYGEATISNDIKSATLVFETINKKRCTITLPPQTLGYSMVSSTFSNTSGKTVKVDVTTFVIATGWSTYGSRGEVQGPSMSCTAH